MHASLQASSQARDPASAPGWDKSCKVFYRAVTAYLTQSSDFYELRLATTLAAQDLFGASAPEVQAVKKAWDVVGVPTAPYPNPKAPKCDVTFATKGPAC